VHDEEWDGDLPLDHARDGVQINGNDFGSEHLMEGIEDGEVVFSQDVLPWNPGFYEVRTIFDVELPIRAHWCTGSIPS
jgi:hypothetical protein